MAARSWVGGSYARGAGGHAKDRRTLWECNGLETAQRQGREGDWNRLAALSDRENAALADASVPALNR